MATLASLSPQRPDDVVVEFEPATDVEVDKAFSAARSAQREWMSVGAAKRRAALDGAANAVEEAAAALSMLVAREVGKPLAEARAELVRTVAILRYYAQQVLDSVGEVLPSVGASLLYTERRPLGVAGVITPWNFPVAIPIWKAAPALACGNAVVLKPAPTATATALALHKAMTRVLGDVLQIVLGDADTGQAVVGTADVVSFTGSAAVGTAVVAAATARGVPVQAEMGGTNATVVCPDVDPTWAARSVAAAAMAFAGQKCTATSRVIVIGDNEQFRDQLTRAVRNLSVGDPFDDETVVGPMISRAALETASAAVEESTSRGATILTGGVRRAGPGWFFEPTLLDDPSATSAVMQREVFGPVCAVTQVATTADAVELANSTAFGLVSSIYTNDLAAALPSIRRLDTGLVRVNEPTTGVDYHAPFGGQRQSSYGPREQGKAAQRFFTSTHTVTVSAAPTMLSRERSA